MPYWTVESNSQKLDGGAMFGNAPKELWKRWMAPDDKNRVLLSTRTLLVPAEDERYILFDAGVGAFFEPKLKERYGVQEEEHMLLKNLEAIGVGEEEIHAVVLSHLHFDHAGGILLQYGEKERLLFPNATFYVGKEHWERAQAPNLREKASFIPKLHELLESSGRLELVDSETHQDLPNVTFRFFNGHTVGLMVSKIQIGKEKIVFLSDLCPGAPWVHLPITMGYDRFPELVVNEKRVFFEELAHDNALVCFVHDPKIPLAKIQMDANGKFSISSI